MHLVSLRGKKIINHDPSADGTQRNFTKEREGDK